MSQHPCAQRLVGCFALLLVGFASPAQAEPAKDHPRLWVRAVDLPTLQTRWQTPSTVRNAFANLVASALSDWQDDEIPELDPGYHTGNISRPSELWGMLFAFMSLIETDPTMKQTYITAAKDILMHIIDQASLGPGTPDANGSYPPFRHPDFGLADRGFYNEAYPLMVDWLQAHPGVLTPQDMAKIRKTFLWWSHEAESATYYTPDNPADLVNDPVLLKLAPPASQSEIDQRTAVRDALNNHYANRLRMQIMMGLALDPADDVPAAPGDNEPAGALTGYVVGPGGDPDDWVYQDTGTIRSGTGSWLYLTDYGLRHDTGGGISPEGLQYMSNGLGPVAMAMLMLQTAGQDDPQQWGPQVQLEGHPFWENAVEAFVHQLPPAPRYVKDWEYVGPSYDLAWYGDGENYVQNDQFVKVIAPLALAEYYRTGDVNGPMQQKARFVEEHLAPGGAAKLAERVTNNYGSRTFRDAIYLFLLFDPTAAPTPDPRNALPKSNFSPFDPTGSMGAIHARTGWQESDSYVDYRLGWNQIDHQHGDGNSFEFWRNGVWLTKRSIGYGGIAANSDFNNALAIENDPLPANHTFFYHRTGARHGSQFQYGPIDDPHIIAKSLAQNFLYVSGDSTNLYNLYSYPDVDDVLHASRDIVWLKPDYIVVYDRAKTATADRFKRFWLSLSDVPQITGNVTHTTVTDTHYQGGSLVSTPKAELFTTTLLPAAATLSVDYKRQMTGYCVLAGGTQIDCDTDEAAQCEYIDAATGKCQCPPPPANDPNWDCPCDCSDQTAIGEPADVRLRVEAAGDPTDTRFLHVLQGGDLGAALQPATHFTTTAGDAFDGALVDDTALLFPVEAEGDVDTLTYTVPATTTGHLVTGLVPNAIYYVTQQSDAGITTTTVAANGPGVQAITDSGGVLVLGPVEPANVSIAVDDATAAEDGLLPATFVVSRSGSTAAPLTVHYTLGGSAGGGSDYVSPAGSIVIPAGAASATLTLTPIDDGDFEGEESIVVTLAADPAYYAAAGVDAATAVIADDDPPTGGFLQFATDAFAANENDGSVAIAVTRVAASAGIVSVTCATSNDSALAGADYQATQQVLTWGNGDIGTKICTVPLLDDASYEDDEKVQLDLKSVSGQAAVGTPGNATLTIVENDPAPIGQLVLSTASITSGEGSSQVVLTVKRINGKGGVASVDYGTVGGSAQAGSDFVAKSGTISWGPNQNQDQTITITLLGDDLFEGGDESFSVQLSNATIPLGNPSSAVVTLTDDDPQPLEFDVGPGWDFETIGSVPWQALVAGSTVRIHAKPTPYFEKFLVSSRGTQDQPIRVIGIPDANGNRPIIDGTNATTSPALHHVSGLFTESHGVVAVARDAQDGANFKPGYVELEGLEVRNATGSFTAANGQTQSYSSLSGSILIHGAEHVSVRDCVLYGSANGLVVRSQGSEPDVSRDIVIEDNVIDGNGWAGQYNGYNLKLHAAGALVQGNRFGTPATGGNVANVEDRAAGAVYRYNRFEGGAPLLQVRESDSSLVRAESTYADAIVYGNLFLDGPNNPNTIVDFGGDTSNGYNRGGALYFFHNTVSIASSNWEPAMVALASAAESLDARNNILHRDPVGVSFGAASLRVLSGAGSASLGRNWISGGWQAGGSVTWNASDLTVGVSPGFVDPADGDYHLDGVAAARDQGGVLHPTMLGSHDVMRQFTDPTGSELRPVDATADHGAFEWGTPPPECGDGVVEGAEACDPGVAGSVCCTAACTLTAGGSVCRAAAGVCDVAEVCDGVAPTCPADTKSLAECRAAAGACDVAETCDGLANDCPADAKSTTECRAAAGACDLAESCNGTANDCPADGKSTSICRPAAGMCDLAESCTGVSDHCPGDAKSTAECRPSQDDCDPAETCDGVGNTCPSDAVAPNGSSCADGQGCDDADVCQAGACTDGGCVASDVCSSGIELQRPRLRLRAEPFSLALRAELVVQQPWVAIDPMQNGLRLAVDGVVDVTVPGGAAWETKADRWRYRDRSGSQGGITKIEVRDLSSRDPGRLRVTIQAKGGSLPLPLADDVRIAIVLGNTDECGALAWNGPGASRPRCDGTEQKLSCR